MAGLNTNRYSSPSKVHCYAEYHFHFISTAGCASWPMRNSRLGILRSNQYSFGG